MWIDTDMMIGITEASSNLYSAFRIADEHGTAVIVKNNKPVYVIYNTDAYKELNTDNIKIKIAIREATRSFSSTAVKIYEAGCILVTRRKHPVYAIFDYNIVRETALETIPLKKYLESMLEDENIESMLEEEGISC